jgi:hypothetical protein
MKRFIKFSAMAILAVVVMFGLVGQASAATSPSLGTADSFSVLAGTAVTNVPTSDITGNVGLSPYAGSYYTGLTASQVTGMIYAVDATGPAGSVANPSGLTMAKNDLITAYDGLIAGGNAACGDGVAGGDGSDGVVDGIDWTGSTIDLAGRTLVPGVYCADAFTLSGTLTLSGGADDVYIFRSTSTIITSSGSSVTGGDACNVWWRAETSATLGTTTDFIGNILALTSISMDTGATLDGRVLARNGAVTLDQNTSTIAPCTSGETLHATLHVIKYVKNNDDGDADAEDFTLYVKSSGTDVAGSPAVGVVSPGRSYSLAPGTYVVSEDDDDYSQSFSGDCNSSGSVTLVNGDDKTCTITNNDEDVDIKVKKTASDYKLNLGPKDVTFTYKVTNEGDVALSDISVEDDECDDVDYEHGDDNDDDMLDINEEWKYECTKKVKETETNKATAEGHANGEEVKDTDTAKVFVSIPSLPNAGIGPDDNFLGMISQQIISFFSF